MAEKAPEKKKAKKAKKPEPKPIPGLGTDDGDSLRDALKAFEVGDHVAVREITGRLEKAEDAQVRAAAVDLASRIAIDPLQVVVLGACGAVLLTIIYIWVL